jgi:hypothetical protein
VAVLEKLRLVLPSPLVAGVFVDRLFLSAAEGPFFDNFFLWFGSHRPTTYNSLSKISPILFYEHARLPNPSYATSKQFLLRLDRPPNGSPHE